MVLYGEVTFLGKVTIQIKKMFGFLFKLFTFLQSIDFPGFYFCFDELNIKTKINEPFIFIRCVAVY